MTWIAPSEKDTTNAAEQAVPAPHSAETDFNGGRPQGLLGRIFLRFAEARFTAIQNLRKTRDRLLPRLLSGQVELHTKAA